MSDDKKEVILSIENPNYRILENGGGAWIKCGTADIKIYPTPAGLNIRVYRDADSTLVADSWVMWKQLEFNLESP